MSDVPTHACDPRHANHENFLLELGRATFEAAGVAQICFDLARVLGGVDSSEMYSDPLGRLINRLKDISDSNNTDGLKHFLGDLEKARTDRNDLLHALPVKDGLYRRITSDLQYEKTFYTVDDIARVTANLTAARRRGNDLLYQDGGAAVRAWSSSH